MSHFSHDTTFQFFCLMAPQETVSCMLDVKDTLKHKEHTQKRRVKDVRVIQIRWELVQQEGYIQDGPTLHCCCWN